MKSKSMSIQNKLDKITQRWWFFAVFILMQVTLLPYASKGYKFPQEWGTVATKVIGNSIIYHVNSYTSLKLAFKVIPMALIILIFLFKNKITRLFNLYLAVSYIIFAFGQGVAITDKYGLAVCTLTLVMFLVVAVFWLWEAIAMQNNFVLEPKPIWRYWVIPVALLAFWYPLSPKTGRPDFDLAHFFTNGAGLAFCTTTPLYIGLLSLYYPKVNLSVLRVTSLVGLITGLYNMHYNFIANFDSLWWNGILHLPLLTISLYGLILSLRKPQEIANGN